MPNAAADALDPFVKGMAILSDAADLPLKIAPLGENFSQMSGDLAQFPLEIPDLGSDRPHLFPQEGFE